jgi:outer membrane protein assembly factor BamE (lipoprotein component of BamABCDE complex)
MRQEITFYSIVRGWALLILCLAWAMFWSACQTTPIHDFTKIQNNMTKDEVLNIVGSPIRTERFDGKEKWAYRFWIGDDHNVEALRQVTFMNNKVVSVGEDVDEEQRIKEIQQDDLKRAERRKQAKAAALLPDGSVSAQPQPSIQQVSEPESKPLIEQDFVEQKGHRAPVSNSEDKDE